MPAMRRTVLVAAAALALPAPAAGSVLVVGDSLEQGTGPHLQRELEGVGVTIDARRGRPSGEGVAVLRARLRPEHEVVVFDLGTNDSPSQPDGLAANLRAARELAGGRCLVVASIQRPPLNGVTVDGLDGAVRDFAAETPTAQLADWRAVTAQPGVLAPDGVHATPDGYALRARAGGRGGAGLPGRRRRAATRASAARTSARGPRPVQVPLPRLRPAAGALRSDPHQPRPAGRVAAGRRVADVLTPGAPEPVLGAG